ncbi:MAG: hypothetical protein IPK19_37955 [Chloroflexi bacterium]|nr:hypothetical protein [Chloroflexota bacterium]
MHPQCASAPLLITSSPCGLSPLADALQPHRLLRRVLWPRVLPLALSRGGDEASPVQVARQVVERSADQAVSSLTWMNRTGSKGCGIARHDRAKAAAVPLDVLPEDVLHHRIAAAAQDVVPPGDRVSITPAASSRPSPSPVWFSPSSSPLLRLSKRSKSGQHRTGKNSCNRLMNWA